MKKAFTVGAIVVFLFCFTVRAFPWGSATHAYIIDQIMRKAGPPRLMYGVMAPDVFNYYFDNIGLRDQLYVMTHFTSYMKVWDVSKGPSDRPSAFGFVSHNNEWGIDSTAHTSALTLPDHAKGYVIQKAEILYNFYLEPLFTLMDIDAVKGKEICHDLVETAIDLMIKYLDPNIGNRLVDSARSSDKKMLDLLVKAYAQDVATIDGIGLDQAIAIIAGNESGFRMAILSLGNALKLKAPNDLNAVAAQLAGLADAAYQVHVDPGIVAQALQAAMLVCSGDFVTEIMATIGFVQGKLAEHYIDY
jgi:hypothetical protein